MRINNKLSILLVLGLVSCSINSPISNKTDNTKIINLTQSNIDNIKIDAGQVKNGTSLSVTLNFKIDLVQRLILMEVLLKQLMILKVTKFI
jgi:hypothetical protein